MLGGDQINVVHSSRILQFDVPFSQLLWRKVKAVALMRNIMVLTEGAAKVAARKEDGAAAVMPLDTGFCLRLVSNDLEDPGWAKGTVCLMYQMCMCMFP